MKTVKKLAITLLILGFLACENTPTPSPINPNTNTGTSSLKDTILKNISYGASPMQVYDIHLPAKRDSSTPVVLFIHGGAWKAGSKSEFDAYVNLMKKEWVSVAIVNMDYRLASNRDSIHHEEIIDDIKSCIGNVLGNKGNYHISSKMAVTGASAGGQLAMIYAYKYNDYNNIKCVGNLFGPSIISDWTWYNSFNLWLGGNVSDILTEYVGKSWDTTAYKAVSPYYQVKSTSQPTIIFHGNLDPIVPLYQSQWLNRKLATLNVQKEYYEYTAFHGFDATQSADVVKKMTAFFKKNM